MILYLKANLTCSLTSVFMDAKSYHNYFVLKYFLIPIKYLKVTIKIVLECADDHRIYSHYIISHMNYLKCDIRIVVVLFYR